MPKDSTPRSLALDLEVARQLGADHGERDLDAWAGVGGAADHLEGFCAVAYLAHAQFVGVRVLFGGEDLTHHDAAELAGSGVTLSTSRPAMDRRATSSSRETCGFTQPRSHCSLNFMLFS
jgi:hypothetical protein